MMGHRQVEQAALFYEFSLEGYIPADHLLRSIDRFVELGELRRELSSFYSMSDFSPPGRPMQRAWQHSAKASAKLATSKPRM